MSQIRYRYRLSDHGKFFATRAKAREIRERIEASAYARGGFILDFAGVDAMTVSFGDELVGKLAEWSSGYGWELSAEGMNAEVRGTVAVVMRRRSLPALV